MHGTEQTAGLRKVGDLRRSPAFSANPFSDLPIHGIRKNTYCHSGLISILRQMRSITKFLAILAFASGAIGARAEEALVAVASNFAEPAAILAEAFAADSEYEINLVYGSTGKLYSQIVNGAPFDIFLAADEARPRALKESGLFLDPYPSVYAIGRLVVWWPARNDIGENGAAELKKSDRGRIAIANPKLAPYGQASVTTMERLELDGESLKGLVLGENVGQVYAFASSGNVDIGFLPYSFMLSPSHSGKGSYWLVPESFHEPIWQAGGQLWRSRANSAATEFQEFLDSPEAASIIEAFGFSVQKADD